MTSKNARSPLTGRVIPSTEEIAMSYALTAGAESGPAAKNVVRVMFILRHDAVDPRPLSLDLAERALNLLRAKKVTLATT